MSDNTSIASGMIEAECRDKLRDVKTAEEALAITMPAAHNHWMFTDEQDQFKGAIGAALITLKRGAEYERLEKSIRQLGRVSALLNALQQGIPVDFEAMEKPEEGLIPLNKLWCDVKWPKEKTA